jgi:hypothetical protein
VGVQRDSDESGISVEIDVADTAPLAVATTCRHLGSLTERYRMQMQIQRSGRVAVFVPWAQTRKEAEDAVESLLERVRAAT